jgi:hypothetical protein
MCNYNLQGILSFILPLLLCNSDFMHVVKQIESSALAYMLIAFNFGLPSIGILNNYR